MEWAKAFTKEVAVVAVALLAAVCILVIFGHVDLKDIGVFGTTIIGGLVLAQQKAAREQNTRIEQNSNGNNEALRTELVKTKDQMTAMAQEHARVLAQVVAALPPGAPLPKALADEHPSEPQPNGGV